MSQSSCSDTRSSSLGQHPYRVPVCPPLAFLTQRCRATFGHVSRRDFEFSVALLCDAPKQGATDVLGVFLCVLLCIIGVLAHIPLVIRSRSSTSAEYRSSSSGVLRGPVIESLQPPRRLIYRTRAISSLRTLNDAFVLVVGARIAMTQITCPGRVKSDERSFTRSCHHI